MGFNISPLTYLNLLCHSTTKAGRDALKAAIIPGLAIRRC
jgi:hypothetical protein